MNTESILDILHFLYGFKDDFTLEELAKVENLTINRFNVAGEIIPVDFRDLVKFPNLKSLTINQCVLDYDIMQIIASLVSLQNLSLYNCEFGDSPVDLFSNLELLTIDIDNTPFSISLLSKQYETIILSNMVIDSPVSFNTQKLNVVHCDIKDFSFLESSNIATLIVSSSQFQLPEISNYHGHMVIMEDNGVMVKDEVNK